MKRAAKLNVLFVTGFGPIVNDVSVSRRLYSESLGIEFKEEEGEYLHTELQELETRGYQMLLKNRREPWGQIVSRFLSPEGLLIGITFTPAFRDKQS